VAGCFALLLARRGYVLTEYTTMEGLLTHGATIDCFITPPHQALDCGIVTAWWHYQVKGHGRTVAARGRATAAAISETTTAFRANPQSART